MPKGVVIFIIFASTVVLPLSRGLRGSLGSICTYLKSRTAQRSVSYLESYEDGWGPWQTTEYRTKWRSETYTAWDEYEKCCRGYRIMYSDTPVDTATPLDIATNWCVPVCEKPCNFGTCTAPEFCTCDYGYTKIDNNSNCEPKCTYECVSGTCIAPETCRCHVGYEKSVWSNNVCVPVCNETCVFGKCIAPNTCVCDVGYAMTSQSGNVCEPVCTNGCLHGTCERPNECKCDQGFFKNEKTNGTCIPICEPGCIHGRCTVGGCSCYFGWDGASCNESRYCLLGAPPELTADGNHIASTASSLDRSATTISQSTKAYAFEEHQGTTDSLSLVTNVKYYETGTIGMKVLFTVDSEVGFTGGRRIQWTGPACDPRCWNAVDQQSVYSGNTSMNRTYSFFLTDSPCNVADGGMELFTILVVALPITGVLLLGIITVVLITCHRKKKRSIISDGTERAIPEESKANFQTNLGIRETYMKELQHLEIYKPDRNRDSCDDREYGNLYETTREKRAESSMDSDATYEVCT